MIQAVVLKEAFLLFSSQGVQVEPTYLLSCGLSGACLCAPQALYLGLHPLSLKSSRLLKAVRH